MRWRSSNCRGGPVPAGSSSDEQVILDEIARLPKMFRDPVVVCCLGGQSYETAAHRLGVSQATLRGRLHRARGRLAASLRKKGVLTLAAARIGEPAGIKVAALPASLVESTVNSHRGGRRSAACSREQRRAGRLPR